MKANEDQKDNEVTTTLTQIPNSIELKNVES